MADLKTNNTSYPTTIDTATAIADFTDEGVATHINGPNSAIVAIENELGVATATNCSLKGTCASLAARLAFNISAAGGVPSGTSFPTSPTPVNGQLFMRTDYTPEILYFYAASTASWVQYSALLTHSQLNHLTDTDDHSQYVHNTIARTISANHEFTVNPVFSGTPSFSHATGVSPFTVTSTTKVTNLNAEQVDGYDVGGTSGLATLSSSLLAQNAPSGFTISGNTAWHSGNHGSSFSVRMSAQQSVSGLTKVQINTELFDTYNNYDTTNYRFTPTIAGKYLLTITLMGQGVSASATSEIHLYKNGSTYAYAHISQSLNYTSIGSGTICIIVGANGSTDYFEVYVSISGTSPAVNQAYFSGILVGI